VSSASIQATNGGSRNRHRYADLVQPGKLLRNRYLRGKREEGRGKREEGRGKREAVRAGRAARAGRTGRAGRAGRAEKRRRAETSAPLRFSACEFPLPSSRLPPPASRPSPFADESVDVPVGILEPRRFHFPRNVNIAFKRHARHIVMLERDSF